MDLAVTLGTSIGVIPYDNGILAYSDCRKTVLPYQPPFLTSFEDKPGCKCFGITDGVYLVTAGSTCYNNIMVNSLRQSVVGKQQDLYTLYVLLLEHAVPSVQQALRNNQTPNMEIRNPHLPEDIINAFALVISDKIIDGYRWEKSAFSIDIRRDNVEVIWMTEQNERRQLGGGLGSPKPEHIAGWYTGDPSKQHYLLAGSGSEAADRVFKKMYAKGGRDITRVTNHVVFAMNRSSLWNPYVGGPMTCVNFQHGITPPVTIETCTPLQIFLRASRMLMKDLDMTLLLRYPRYYTGVMSELVYQDNFIKELQQRSDVRYVNYFMLHGQYIYWRMFIKEDDAFDKILLEYKAEEDHGDPFNFYDMGNGYAIARCTINILESLS